MNFLSFGLLFSIFIWSLIFSHALFVTYLLLIGAYWALGVYYGWSSVTSFRNKIRIATWNDGGYPTAFGRLEIDLDALDAFLDDYNSKNPDNKMTYTVIFAKAVGMGLSVSPHLCGHLSFTSFMPQQDVNISVLCDINGENLTNVLIEGCDKRSLGELNDQLKAKVKKYKTGRDENFNKQIDITNILPVFVVQALLRASSWICYDLGLPVAPLRMDAYNYGTAILTNPSSFNSYDSLAPHVPFMKCILVALMNTPKMRPVVVDNKVVMRKIMYVNITYDHRFADGSDAPKVLAAVQDVLRNPSKYI